MFGHQAEGKQEEIQAQLSAIVESSDDAIISKDLEGKILTWNRAAQKIYGYTTKEAIGQTIYILMPQGHKKEMADFLDKIKHGKLIKHFETKRLHKDGRIINVSVTISPIKDSTGKIVGASTIARDIADRKEIERKLRIAAEEWDRTFNSISDFILIQDKDHTIIKANQAFLQEFSVKIGDIIGRKCYDVVHKLNKPWPNCPFEKTKIDKLTHTEEVDDANVGYPLLITTSQILDEKGEIAAIVHIAKNISGQKKVEKELRDKINTLERFQKVTVDRELKMKELKKNIEELQECCKAKESIKQE